jgi:hypothetical protein
MIQGHSLIFTVPSSDRSSVVGHLTLNTKFEGSNPGQADAEREKNSGNIYILYYVI